jgi:hypothetical protein
METYIAPVLVLLFILVLRFTKLKIYIKESLVLQTFLLLILVGLFICNLIDYKNTFSYNIKIGILFIAIILSISSYFKKIKAN